MRLARRGCLARNATHVLCVNNEALFDWIEVSHTDFTDNHGWVKITLVTVVSGRSFFKISHWKRKGSYVACVETPWWCSESNVFAYSSSRYGGLGSQSNIDTLCEAILNKRSIIGCKFKLFVSRLPYRFTRRRPSLQMSGNLQASARIRESLAESLSCAWSASTTESHLIADYQTVTNRY